jgi:transglutaminase-like putative cysteine protease
MPGRAGPKGPHVKLDEASPADVGVERSQVHPFPRPARRATSSYRSQVHGFDLRLSVSHATTYRYARPVVLEPHRLRLHPRSTHSLAIVYATIACTPPATLEWSQDVLGNLVAVAAFHEMAAELRIVSQFVVDLNVEAWPLFQVDLSAHNFPFGYSPDELIDLGGFVAPAHEAAPDVASWTQGFVRGRPTDTLSLLKDINAGVRAAIFYQARDEEGVQSPSETLSKASGSCRDFAALFIEAVRHLGFGARAVSGYLADPAPAAGGATSHAWAEVYLPGAGWIAFDPTHNRVGGGNLIPIAVGRAIDAIVPVTGRYGGDPGDFREMTVEVSVTPAA